MKRLAILKLLNADKVCEILPTLPDKVRRRLDLYANQEKIRLANIYQLETSLHNQGFSLIAGTDEAGRGPLAGPLVAAGVIFSSQPWIPFLQDSKGLREEEREVLYDQIMAKATAVAIEVVEVDEINDSNLHRLSLEAMKRAITKLKPQPDFVLVDGKYNLPLLLPQHPIIKGDSVSASIAAASIVAKVTRDRIMKKLDTVFPGYGFARHKGYGTKEHIKAILKLGPTPIHRMNFAPCRAAVRT